MTKTLKKAITLALCSLFATLVCFFLGLEMGYRSDANESTASQNAATFEVTGGLAAPKTTESYDMIYDGKTDTKYCLALTSTKTPYVTFRASDVGTVVTGYTLYTGKDTQNHSSRNPKDWTLYGSNNGIEWTSIHQVSNDDTLGDTNETGYPFTFENTTPYWQYKIEFTARHGASGTDSDLMQISEIKFTASITDALEIRTVDELATAFANGGKAKLVGDIALTSDLSLSQKTLELDLNGHVISGQKLSVMGASSVSHSILILKDSNPSATHTDTSLPSGGVVASGLSLTRNSSDETWANKAYLYANGGTVVQQLKIDTSSSQIDYLGDTMTLFKAGIHGAGATINAGFYYGSVVSTNTDKPYVTSNKKVEFKVGDNVYATQYLRSGDKAICPADPAVEGYTFIKWYNSATNNYHDFSSTVTSDLTIKAMLMKEVGTFDELKSEITGGNSVKLTADITMTDDFSITSGKNITIDLNGHVIDGNGKQIYGTGCGGTKTPGPATKLTIIDSNPNATHTDASLPVGGYINAKISITASSNYSGDTGEFYLYVNGGTIREVYSNSFAGYVIWSDGTAPSVIEKISGDATVRGGLYYYEQSISDYNDGTVRKVTYKDGDNVYAVLGMNGNTATKKAVEPKEPAKKSGYVFDSWYNGDTKYDFSSTVTENLTLSARWIEDNTAPVIDGVNASDSYCTSKEVTVTDTNLDKVTVDGEEVTLTDGKFTLDMSSGADKVIVATDKALNSTTLTVKYGHNFGDWIDEQPNSCISNGTVGHKDCSACNKHFDNDGNELTDLTIKAAGHTWSTSQIIAETPADCINDGVVEHWHCSTCNKDYAADKTTELTDLTIKAAGHTWSTSQIIAGTPADCINDGVVEHWHCSTCNKDYAADKTTELTDLTISAKGHSFGDWIDEVPATSESEGVKAHKDCSACNKHFDNDGNELTDLTIAKRPESLSGGAIAAIVIGSVVVLGGGGFAVVWFVIKKRSFADLIAAIKGIFKK